MALKNELRNLLELEERTSVGASFGSSSGQSKSFSVGAVRDWILENVPSSGGSDVTVTLMRLRRSLAPRPFKVALAGAIRFSFLIELTDLKVGSTKMKTRWMPGFILMPHQDSFEPIKGIFAPGNDPRSAPFEECFMIFQAYCRMLCKELEDDASLGQFIEDLHLTRRVPYELPFGYVDPKAEPMHVATNLTWIKNDDIRWLVQARQTLQRVQQPPMRKRFA